MTYSLKLLTYLAPSTVCEGIGVFSLVNIPRNTIVFRPQKIEKIPWGHLPPQLHSKIQLLTMNDEDGFLIDCDLDRIHSAYYINHTEKNQNVRYDSKKRTWVATKNINKDEELLNTYALEEQDWLT